MSKSLSIMLGLGMLISVVVPLYFVGPVYADELRNMFMPPAIHQLSEFPELEPVSP